MLKKSMPVTGARMNYFRAFRGGLYTQLRFRSEIFVSFIPTLNTNMCITFKNVQFLANYADNSDNGKEFTHLIIKKLTGDKPV